MEKIIILIIICIAGIFILTFYINWQIYCRKEQRKRLLYKYSDTLGIDSNNLLKNDIESCSICLSPVISNNIRIKCNHIFHTKCLETWTAKNINNNKLPQCPNCNQQYLELVN